jgi:Uma2 family endonuclease
MEVYKTLPEGTLAELIENVLYTSPAPVFNHQKVSKSIFRHLLEHLEDKGLGQVFMAPFDVYLDETQNAVQPDLIIVLESNYKIIDKGGHIHGVPDVLIEILSKGNREHDLIRKKDLYERFKVKEYWIIDPESKLAMVFELRNNSYALTGEYIGEVRSNFLALTLTF